jgi:hypothetical protein
MIRFTKMNVCLFSNESNRELGEIWMCVQIRADCVTTERDFTKYYKGLIGWGDGLLISALG